jgi:serine/threonine-protein kinase
MKKNKSFLCDIPGYDSFVKIEPIKKGWSSDKKFRIETADNQKLFLRVSDISEHDKKKADYMMIEQIYKVGVSTSQPFGFGICGNGKNIYSLSKWIDGVGADEALPLMSECEQYVLGTKAGEILRKIHSIPAPENIEAWGVRFRRKLKSWIDEYNFRPQIHSDIGDFLVRYLEEHLDIIDSRPQTFIHGDCNIENIIVMPNGEISVIDLSSFNTPYADPWWDMNNMAWMPVMFPHFYIGQIKGYFNGGPPPEFWNVFYCYLAYDALAAATDPYGLNGIEDGTEIVNNILRWTDNFKNSIPTWYL